LKTFVVVQAERLASLPASLETLKETIGATTVGVRLKARARMFDSTPREDGVQDETVSLDLVWVNPGATCVRYRVWET